MLWQWRLERQGIIVTLLQVYDTAVAGWLPIWWVLSSSFGFVHILGVAGKLSPLALKPAKHLHPVVAFQWSARQSSCHAAENYVVALTRFIA